MWATVGFVVIVSVVVHGVAATPVMQRLDDAARWSDQRPGPGADPRRAVGQGPV